MVIVSEGYKFIGAALILAVILGFFAGVLFCVFLPQPHA